MSFLYAILIGLFIGGLARFLFPARFKMGLVLTAFLGLCGSLLATYLGQKFGWYGVQEKAGIPAAVLGAIVILLAVRFFKSAD